MSHNCLENIYNYLKISEKIATSGQPSVEEFLHIKQAGYQVVVNLALKDSSNTLRHEKEIVETQGMEYVHIPVIWENPTKENFQEFIQVMKTNADQKVFVHCAANKRVSAFIYLYRRYIENLDDETAKKDLHKIWIPNETWQQFMQNVQNKSQ
ncbi:protein tyrosine phosphatase family protein [Rivularia sp. UHCC 0363]|uniref:protein tyrosine phosphatase family protein n=1 Tax=Rivularia sp. UHCC 0363 TaxID=3110244 RepID=UPI002B1ED410|nr:protein tyrosine phosphatase family protein [Rivularia sp. UHCC 0363]MEA5595148.1 protein tyrosine phosphatase family protein [Rivularia sp. UHCC 0363]